MDMVARTFNLFGQVGVAPLGRASTLTRGQPQP
jgi:hypothetical protein